MKNISLKDLRESLTLLFSHTQDDGEGGWKESWQRMKHLHGAIWPLIPSPKNRKPQYRVLIRAEYQLPSKFAFLWHLHRKSKRLVATHKPLLIHHNRFLSITTEEDNHA